MSSSNSSAKRRIVSKKIYKLARVPARVPECDGGPVSDLQGLRGRRRPMCRGPRMGPGRILRSNLWTTLSTGGARLGEQREPAPRLARPPRTHASAHGGPRVVYHGSVSVSACILCDHLEGCRRFALGEGGRIYVSELEEDRHLEREAGGARPRGDAPKSSLREADEACPASTATSRRTATSASTINAGRSEMI